MSSIDPELAARIDMLLPQTQCTKCGYPGCRPYADALAAGKADINQCPPGGDAGIRTLAALLQRPYKPLNPENGTEQTLRVALIDEALCIGCTLCIQACPVDAIIGGPKHMHTVIAEQCTGCDLCVPPCPVDCIAMVPAAGKNAFWTDARADASRRRFGQHQQRRHVEREKRIGQFAMQASPSNPEPSIKPALIHAAIERARIQRSKTPEKGGLDADTVRIQCGERRAENEGNTNTATGSK